MPKSIGDSWQLDKRVRDLAASLILCKEYTDKQVAALSGAGLRTIERIKANLVMFGVPYNPITLVKGRPRLITPEITTHLRLFLFKKPTAYLDEVIWWLNDVFDLQIDISTLSRHLHRIGWTRKVAVKVALKRSESQRQWFKQTVMSQYEDYELIFIDESAAQERTGDRRYSWSPLGETPI